MSRGALVACSTLNGKYCHCQVELGRGPTRSFFISILRASIGLGKEPGVSVLQEMVKPTWKARCGVPGLFLEHRELEGKPTLCKRCSVLGSRFYFRGLAPC